MDIFCRNSNLYIIDNNSNYRTYNINDMFIRKLSEADNDFTHEIGKFNENSILIEEKAANSIIEYIKEKIKPTENSIFNEFLKFENNCFIHNFSNSFLTLPLIFIKSIIFQLSTPIGAHLRFKVFSGDIDIYIPLVKDKDELLTEYQKLQKWINNYYFNFLTQKSIEEEKKILETEFLL